MTAETQEEKNVRQWWDFLTLTVAHTYSLLFELLNYY